MHATLACTSNLAKCGKPSTWQPCAKGYKLIRSKPVNHLVLIYMLMTLSPLQLTKVTILSPRHLTNTYTSYKISLTHGKLKLTKQSRYYSPEGKLNQHHQRSTPHNYNGLRALKTLD
ncbi:hypothetical protein TNCV_1199011 [Trichonephila clavipes]|uniref:Uncharacterized protein n=1 Tax=Trichonephila clavipes TaxID=2585209 RepID=A0A8X6S3H1_TRICX|nr:hypothetical protein TNCV_1199011 [Trichonephila clavipes]